MNNKTICEGSSNMSKSKSADGVRKVRSIRELNIFKSLRPKKKPQPLETTMNLHIFRGLIPIEMCEFKMNLQESYNHFLSQVQNVIKNFSETNYELFFKHNDKLLEIDTNHEFKHLMSMVSKKINQCHIFVKFDEPDVLFDSELIEQFKEQAIKSIYIEEPRLDKKSAGDAKQKYKMPWRRSHSSSQSKGKEMKEIEERKKEIGQRKKEAKENFEETHKTLVSILAMCLDLGNCRGPPT